MNRGKLTEHAIAWLVASLLLLGVLAGLAVVNILVSLQYETVTPNDCISQITGYDLCWHLRLSQVLFSGSLLIALLVTLSAWLRRAR
jgi:hypothetical protein